MTWTNWAGNQRCAPTAVLHPRSEAELVQIVRAAAAAGETVKVVGSGHSFTDIACTSGRQVVLDGYGEVLRVDRDARQVSVQAGIELRALGAALARHGLAMPNLGDIAYQTISGAISTGTHGTGLRFGGLATQVAALRLVLADGSVVGCSAEEEPELFAAARVGLGALGIISEVTLQCVPAFSLRAVEKAMGVDRVLANLDRYVEENEHFEFYYVPHTPIALTKRNNRTDDPADDSLRHRAQVLRDKILLENVAFGAACRLGRMRPEWIPRLATAVPGSSRSEYVERSDRVFTSPRWVHFYEMEYAIPRPAIPAALTAVRRLIDDTGLRISFPIEVRVAAADDLWLSTASGRESGYIAVHVYRGMPYEQYFRGVEQIMDAHGGRPHWGKLHFQTAATLRDRYPRFDDFLALRDRLDPDRRFTNPYLQRVLGS